MIRIAVLVMLGTSTPCRGFRKSGNLLRSNWWNNNNNIPLLLVTESLPKGAADGPCPLPPAWSLTCSKTGWDAPLSWPVILMEATWNCSKKERGLFYTVWKKPQIPCAHLFYPSNVSKNVCVWLLVSGLLYFVDQPYFCLVSGRQVQLHSRFGLALHSSFHVFWCALLELIVLPMPKMLFSMSPFAADS